MILRVTAAAVIGFVLLAPAGVAQTVAEQMQKGIYAQETAGDPDAAIRIYRQILNSSPADRKYAAMAQFRMVQALLQKGDLQEAARELQTLSNHPEYKDLVAAMAGRWWGTSHGSVIRRGVYSTETGRGGIYINNATGVQLTVPAGWSLVDSDSSGGGEMATLTADNGKGELYVWMKSDSRGRTASELAEMLRNDLAVKPGDRKDRHGWRVRPESIQMGGAGEHQFLKAVADFSLNGRKMVEYLVWARTPKSHVFFFRSAAATAENERPLAEFEQVVSTAVLP